MERSLGDVGTRLLFEHDRVKVWEMLIETGAFSDLHRHEYEHSCVVVEGESIDADFANGRSIRAG